MSALYVVFITLAACLLVILGMVIRRRRIRIKHILYPYQDSYRMIRNALCQMSSENISSDIEENANLPLFIENKK